MVEQGNNGIATVVAGPKERPSAVEALGLTDCLSMGAQHTIRAFEGTANGHMDKNTCYLIFSHIVHDLSRQHYGVSPELKTNLERHYGL